MSSPWMDQYGYEHGPAASPATRRDPWRLLWPSFVVVLLVAAIVLGILLVQARSNLDRTKTTLNIARDAADQDSSALSSSQAKLRATQKTLAAAQAQLKQDKAELKNANSTSDSNTKLISDLRTCVNGLDAINASLADNEDESARQALLTQIRGACARANLSQISGTG